MCDVDVSATVWLGKGSFLTGPTDPCELLTAMFVAKRIFCSTAIFQAKLPDCSTWVFDEEKVEIRVMTAEE